MLGICPPPAKRQVTFALASELDPFPVWPPSDAIDTHTVTIGHGDPGCHDRLNTLYFRVPVLNEEMPMAGTDKLTLMLDSSVVSAEQSRLYFEVGRVGQDSVADLQSFYDPIQRALLTKLQSLTTARVRNSMCPMHFSSQTQTGKCPEQMTNNREDEKPERGIWEPGEPNDAPLTPSSHAQLWQIAIKLPTDYEPYGQMKRVSGYRSCGCLWFRPLVTSPHDWGVCANPASPRTGLLTFEHQGCPHFEEDIRGRDHSE
jgi:hypothetical protein